MNYSAISYPAIQKYASKCSKLYQKLHALLIAANLSVLVLTATIDFFKPNEMPFDYPKTFLLILSALIAALGTTLKFDKKWFAARSLSETVKSLVWRFQTNAVPFNNPNMNNESIFLDRISAACHESNALLRDNKFKLSLEDSNFSSGLLKKPLTETASLYVVDRVHKQLIWYNNKSHKNIVKSRLYFCLFLACNCAAMTLSYLQESDRFSSGATIGLLVACATALIGWIESRKYEDLASAYTLTKNEIQLLESDIHSILTESDLAKFVAEAELLFSREHTQWAAKRGYAISK